MVSQKCIMIQDYRMERVGCSSKKIGVKIELLQGINLDLVVAKVKKDLSKLEIPF